ncbi:MAG: hypothetical protein H0V82_06420 [Candidatus Protochlamydia sp.]|nr:hypothetical protein [Candidatus Protochlamydia sp.]
MPKGIEGTQIEGTKYIVPKAYENLLNIDPSLVKEMGKKSIDFILLDFIAAEGSMRVQNKKIVFETRAISYENQNQKVKDKLNEYDRFAPIVTSGLSTLGEMGAAFAGPGGASFLSAGAKAVGAFENQLEKRSKGKIEQIDHRYQTEGSLLQEKGQLLKEEDGNFDRALSVLDRVHQAQQRVIENLGALS